MNNRAPRTDNTVDRSSRGCLRVLAVLFLSWGMVLGTMSLMQLADAFRDLDETQQARELLEEAYRVAPDDRTLRGRLSALGYTWDGRDLVPPERRARRRKQKAITTEQVQAQFGKPESVCRVMTAEGVVEQWLFESKPPLYITFRHGKVIASSLPLSTPADR